jgi:hypothetical protein
MGLDYDGKPRQPFKRKLKDPSSRVLSTNPDILTEEEDVLEDDVVFDEIAKVFIKGQKLKEGLGNMNPLAFIPVEEDASVRSAIQRIDETADTSVITFGMFKEAVEFIVSKGEDINEQFLLNLNVVDEGKINKRVKKKRKGQSDHENDLVSQFLEGLSPFAGLVIMGLLNDVASINSPKQGIPDGDNAGQQVPSWHSQGLGVGISLLIELGAIEFQDSFLDNSKIIKPDVRRKIKQLRASPTERKQELEKIGLDYEEMRRNRQFDDYLAIKRYALNYIASIGNNLNYDHWIAWVNVSENQSLLRGALAISPMFSNKWRKFYKTNDHRFVSKTESVEIDDDDDLDLEETITTGLITGIRSYLSSMASVSTEHYDKTFLAYSMQLDARLMCCILWFLGPLELDTLEDLSEILRLLGYNASISLQDMVAFMSETALVAVMNMIAAHVNKLIDELFTDIAEKLFEIPEDDWEVAIKYCIGINIIFNLIERAFQFMTKLVNDIIQELQSTLEIGFMNKSALQVDVAANRKYIISLAALIDSIISELDLARRKCQLPLDDDPRKYNDLAAQAAVDFVVNVVPDLYPTLELSETVRRKMFSNIPSFKTDMNLEVPGTDESGNQEELTIEEQVTECGEGSRALGGLTIGKKIADIMEGRA